MLKTAASTVLKFGEVAAGVGAIVAGVSLKMAADLQKTMMLVRTQAHDTTDNLGDMTNKVVELSTKVGISADKLAEGLYHVTSVGYRGAEAMNILTIAAEGARVGNADLDSTTYALTSTMQTYGLAGDKAAETMATLNSIVGAGDMRFQDLNAAISTGFLAAGETFGVSIQSMGAALAYLTDRGASADESATRLKMSINLLGAPTSHAIGLLKDLGLTQEEATTRATAMEQALKKSGLSITKLSDDLRQPDGIEVALKDLVDHMHQGGLSADEMAAVLSRAFGGGRSGAAIMSMVEHLDTLRQKFDTVNSGAKRFDQDWIDTQKTFNFQLDRLRTNVEAVAIRLGDRLLPAATTFVKFLADHLSVIQGWVESLDSLGQRLGAFYQGTGGLVGQMYGGTQATQEQTGRGAGAPTGPTTRVVPGLGGAAERRLSEGGAAKSAQPGVFVSGDSARAGVISSSTASAAMGHELAQSILTHAKELAHALVEVFKQAAEQIDWTGVGIFIGEQAIPFIVGLAGTLMDPFKISDAIVKSILRHPTEWVAVASFLASIIFVPERIAFFIGEILSKVPFAGPFLRWIFMAINSLGGPIRSLLNEWFRTVFSRELFATLEHTAIIGDFARAGGGILSAIRRLFDEIGLRFLGSADVIRGALSHLMNMIGTEFYIGARLLGERFWTALKLVWEGWGGRELGGFAAEFGRLFSGIADAATRGARFLATGFWSNLKVVWEGWGIPQLGGILREFVNFLGDVGSAFFRGAGWVKDIIVRLLGDLFSTIGSGLDRVLKIVEGWVGNILGFFWNLFMRLIGASIIPDLVNGIVHWFTNLTVWVFAIVDGWVNNVIRRFEELKDGITNAAKGIASSLIDHLGGGINAALKLFRDFLTALGNIPGIGVILKDSEKVLANLDLGGAKKAVGLATGGMITNGPSYIVGEGNSAFPEWVLPSDPAHRGRAMELLGSFVKAIGLASGGVMGGYRNPYPEGECTFYVASRFPGLPIDGNAGNWGSLPLQHVSSPAPGEIVVYRPGSHYSGFGHVAVVESTMMGNNQFQVSEMNYVGHGVTSSRMSDMTDVVTFLVPGVPGVGSPATGTSGGGFSTSGPLVDAALKAAQGMLGGIPDWLRGFVGGLLPKIAEGVKSKLLSFVGGTPSGGPITGGHLDLLHAAEKIAGVDGSWDQGLDLIISHESSWNSAARNNWDSNAQAGNASVGLGQLTGTNRARYDPDETPVGQIVGIIRYVLARYGGIGNVPGVRSVLSGGAYRPYDSGGLLPPGLTLAYNGTGRNETVLPPGGLGGDLGAKLDRANELLYAILTDAPAVSGFTANLRAG